MISAAAALVISQKGSSFGPELIVGGDFTSSVDAAWDAISSATLSSVSGGSGAPNNLKVENGIAAACAAGQDFTTVSGQTYIMTVLIKPQLPPNCKVSVHSAAYNYNGDLVNSAASTSGWNSYEYEFTATSTTSYLAFYANSATIGQFIEVDTVSIRAKL